MKKLDRMALTRSLEQVKDQNRRGKGILRLIYEAGLWTPTRNVASGVYGDAVQNLIGGAYTGPVADFGLSELKTRYAQTSSATTLGAYTDEDFNGDFIHSRIYKKIQKTVFAELGDHYEPFIEGNVALPDRGIKSIFSLDLDNEIMFSIFEQDFNVYRDAAFAGIEPEYITQYMFLEDSKAGKCWRLRPAAIRAIADADAFESNTLFTWGN